MKFLKNFSSTRTSLPQSEEVLVIVDFINPFCFYKSKRLLPSALKAAIIVKRLIENSRASGIPIIYANDNYGIWQSDFNFILNECIKLKGAKGRISLLLAPKEKDIAILKPQHSAFHSTPLDYILKIIGAKRLIICGVATDMCVLLTATDACMLGYDVWVPKNCTAAESKKSKKHTLKNLKLKFKCSTNKYRSI